MQRVQFLSGTQMRGSQFGISPNNQFGRLISRRSKGTLASEEEVAHFRALAPTWWDTNGSQRILHLMNLGRLDFIQRTMRGTIKVSDPDTFVPGFNYKDFLPNHVSMNIKNELDSEIATGLMEKKLKLLDIGCGGGILAESMARLSYIDHVTGIDLTPEVIAVAKEHAKLDPIVTMKVDYQLEALENIKGQYDIITCFEMLEHVDIPSEILKHAWSNLKPNGILFISTINRDFVSWFTTIFMGEKVLKIVPDGTHNLNKYINASEIEEWFQENEPRNHEVLDIKGTMYLPTKGWVEHNYTEVGNYFMAIKKLNR